VLISYGVGAIVWMYLALRETKAACGLRETEGICNLMTTLGAIRCQPRHLLSESRQKGSAPPSSLEVSTGLTTIQRTAEYLSMMVRRRVVTWEGTGTTDSVTSSLKHS